MSDLCQFSGQHNDEREAVLRAGWSCIGGHIIMANYCQGCWDVLNAHDAQFDRSLCSPYGLDGFGVCREESSLLEVITLKVKETL